MQMQYDYHYAARSEKTDFVSSPSWVVSTPLKHDISLKQQMRSRKIMILSFQLFLQT